MFVPNKLEINNFAPNKVSRAVLNHKTHYAFTKNQISQTEPLITVGTGTYCIGWRSTIQFFVCFKCDNFQASKDVYHSSSLSDMVTTLVSLGQDDVFWSGNQSEEQPPKVCKSWVFGTVCRCQHLAQFPCTLSYPCPSLLESHHLYSNWVSLISKEDSIDKDLLPFLCTLWFVAEKLVNLYNSGESVVLFCFVF